MILTRPTCNQRACNAAVSIEPRGGKRRPGKRRRGNVFEDRYHAEIIETPRQARRSLAYVINNWRKHREDRTGLARTWRVDPFSSGSSFADWKELEASPVMWRARETYDPLVVYRPTTWLLAEGWKRHGLISVWEVPRPAR